MAVKSFKQKLAIFGISIVCIPLILYVSCYPYTTSFEQTITVVTRETKRFKGDNSDTYLIGTSAGDSFKVEDSFLQWQFRSFDLYSKLQVGQSYKIKAFGWRIGFLSQFPTIYSVEPQ